MLGAKRIVKSINRILSPVGIEVIKRSDESVLKQFDPQIRETVDLVKPYTMTPVYKITELCEAVRYLSRNEIPGDFVECGVWRGGSMMASALTLLQENDAERQLYLFDTFSGMSEPTQHDISLTSGNRAIDKYRDRARSDSGSDWCFASQEEVRENMAITRYPEHLVHLVPGKVEDTIPEYAPAKIALLRLDTDWYESTLHELNNLFDRVQAGGVLIIDDYDSWQGARKATDEFLEARSEKIFLHRMGGKLGRIAIVR